MTNAILKFGFKLRGIVMKNSERYLLKGLPIIGGIASILLGIDIYKKGIISEWNIAVRIIDDSNRLFFLILHVLIGILFIVYGLRSKTGVYQADIFLACENCAKVVRKEEGKNSICSGCGFKLEPLEGFYDRHPEHRPSGNHSETSV